MTVTARPVGAFLREWRQLRRMSQLNLACEAEISSRHLSFVETGRAKPSREMLLHLCEHLAVPLRERNLFLLAAGYAPVFPLRPLDDPALDAARKAIDLVLSAHEPFPALAVDRQWNLVTANRIVPHLMAGAAPALLEPPVNVLRLSLHPDGLAPRIANFAEWREHLLVRLRQQIEVSADDALIALRDELSALPWPAGAAQKPPSAETRYGGIAVPLQFSTEQGLLSLISTTTVFGTPVDVTLSELAIEAFFPADEESGNLLRLLAEDLS